MTSLDFSEETPPSPGGFRFDAVEARRVVARHRGLIVGCVLLSLAAAAVVSYLTQPLYRATALMTLERERESPFDLVASVNRERGQEISVETVARLLTSREVVERAVRQLRLAEPATAPAAAVPAAGAAPPKDAELDPVTRLAVALAPTIDVRALRNTSLLEVSVTAHSAKRAADLANAVTDSFIAWKLDSRFRLLGQASEFLSSQIADAKVTLTQKEERLAAFGRRKDILSGDTSSPNGAKVDALQRDAAAATADRIGKEAREAELTRSDAATVAATSPNVIAIRSEIGRLEQEYAEKLKLFKPDWPAMVQLKAQIEKRRQDLANAIADAGAAAREGARADVASARRREEGLKAALQAQRSEAMSVNADAVAYNALKAETETQRALVDNLQKR